MPCFDGREDEDRAHASEGADILCQLMRRFEDDMTVVTYSDNKIAGRLAAWWQEHKKRDGIG